MKSVIVFGGSGYVGQNVIKQLLNRNVRVVAVNRTGRPASHGILPSALKDRVSWVHADAADVQSWQSSVNSDTIGAISCVGALGLNQAVCSVSLLSV